MTNYATMYGHQQRASAAGIINGHHMCEGILHHVALRNMCTIHRGSEDYEPFERTTHTTTNRRGHAGIPHGK
jgi:hypothetical protein